MTISDPIGKQALFRGIARDVRDHCLREGCTTINALAERYGRTPHQVDRAIEAHAAWFERTTVARRGSSETPAVVVTEAGQAAARTDPFREYRNLPAMGEGQPTHAAAATDTGATETDTESPDGRRTEVSS